MNLAFLTTDTAHHAYFARKLAAEYALSLIVAETSPPQAPFETRHPFEDLRDEYEREVLLLGFDGTLADLGLTRAVQNVNEAAPLLGEAAPDVTVVFGTGILRPETIAVAGRCLNLHGGDPEEYRGLDTHLWAIYHRDFPALQTTLHVVDEELDCGPIVHREPVPLHPQMPLHELRAANTRLCVELALRALRELERTGSLQAQPQQSRGRYYSFMPAVLKDRCVVEFERHTASL